MTRRIDAGGLEDRRRCSWTPGAPLCMEGGQGDPHQLLHFVFNHHYLGGLNGRIQGKEIDAC